MSLTEISSSATHPPVLSFFLVGHPSLQPEDFVKPTVLEHNHEDYMFLGCIRFIDEVSLYFILLFI